MSTPDPSWHTRETACGDSIKLVANIHVSQGWKLRSLQQLYAHMVLQAATKGKLMIFVSMTSHVCGVSAVLCVWMLQVISCGPDSGAEERGGREGWKEREGQEGWPPWVCHRRPPPQNGRWHAPRTRSPAQRTWKEDPVCVSMQFGAGGKSPPEYSCLRTRETTSKHPRTGA